MISENEFIKSFDTKLATPKKRGLIQKLVKKNLNVKFLDYIESLLTSNEHYKTELASYTLIPQLYVLNPEKSQKLIISFACNPDWVIREEAANILKSLNKEILDQMLPIYEKWINKSSVKSSSDGKDLSGNPILSERSYLQRAFSVGLIGIKDKSYLNELCELITLILYNTDRYVRINLGPFGLAWFQAQHSEVVDKMVEKWLEIKDENVLWNLVMMYSQVKGKKDPEIGLKLVERVSMINKDLNSKLLYNGCRSVLRNINKFHKDLVEKFLKDNGSLIKL